MVRIHGALGGPGGERDTQNRSCRKCLGGEEEDLRRNQVNINGGGHFERVRCGVSENVENMDFEISWQRLNPGCALPELCNFWQLPLNLRIVILKITWQILCIS